MTKHEQTIENHVRANVTMAIDQQDEYGGLRAAFDSFCQNTADSVLADGYTGEEAMEAGLWFIAMFNQQVGAEF